MIEGDPKGKIPTPEVSPDGAAGVVQWVQGETGQHASILVPDSQRPGELKNELVRDGNFIGPQGE